MNEKVSFSINDVCYLTLSGDLDAEWTREGFHLGRHSSPGSWNADGSRDVP